MKSIKLTKRTLINGVWHKKGKVLELDDKTANLLINTGGAEASKKESTSKK